MKETLFSNLLLKTYRQAPTNVTDPIHGLLIRSGLMTQLDSGVYIFNTPMVIYLNKVSKYIEDKVDSLFSKIMLPTLTPISLWEQSGRFEKYTERFTAGDYILSPTCEESVTYLAKTVIQSYKDLPKAVYQISNKYRDELRPQAGLIRTKEFIMKDGYSFHESKEDLVDFYNKVKALYSELFDSLNINYEIVEADNGDIGGSQSLEFLVNGIEIAHIFQLDTKYSDSFDLTYKTKDNTYQPVYMGCYGIGISRLAQLLLSYDDKGLLFPKEFKLYDYVVLSKDDTTLEDVRGNTYGEMNLPVTLYPEYVLVDDRNCNFGAKIKDAELMGLNKLILSEGEIKNYEPR